MTMGDRDCPEHDDSSEKNENEPHVNEEPSIERMHSFEIEGLTLSKPMAPIRSRHCCAAILQSCILATILACVMTVYVFIFPLDPTDISTNTCSNDTSVKLLMEQIDGSSDLCDPNFEGECQCNSPLIPQLRKNKQDVFMRRWNATFERNKQLAGQFFDDGEEFDVVFFGDSITEHWEGTELGTPAWEGVNLVFREEFTRIGGGRLDGLALGIAGDRCGQLLYRLRNGELPATLDAKVFWVLIGTNDMGSDKCAVQAVAAGNFRIVKEIHSRRPNAKIVLNSMLPFLSRSGKRDEEIFESKDWEAASRFNHRLECYAESTENVYFFNATDLFISEDEPYEKYFEDSVHPSVAGSRRWSRAIVATVLELINESRKSG